MLVVIPTSQTDKTYDQVTILDGREYVLRFEWGARDESWYLGIYDQDENPIQIGMRVAVGVSLLKRATDARIPKGTLVAVDLQGNDEEAGASDLGGRVALLYDEVAA